MLNKLRKKMRQRGVAMIEYAILLSFVAVVAVGFISSDGMVKPINDIVNKVVMLLDGEVGPIVGKLQDETFREKLASLFDSGTNDKKLDTNGNLMAFAVATAVAADPNKHNQPNEHKELAKSLGYTNWIIADSNFPDNPNKKTVADQFLEKASEFARENVTIEQITGTDVNPEHWTIKAPETGQKTLNWNDGKTGYCMSYDLTNGKYSVCATNNLSAMEKNNPITYNGVKAENLTYEQAVEIYNANAHPKGK